MNNVINFYEKKAENEKLAEQKFDQFIADNPDTWDALTSGFLTQEYLEKAYNHLCTSEPQFEAPAIDENDTQRVVNFSVWNAAIPMAMWSFKKEKPDLYEKAINLLYQYTEEVTDTEDFSLREMLFMEQWFQYTSGVDRPSSD
jgi:hypothetical protein